MKRNFLAIVLIGLMALSISPENIELFDGESKLEHCKQNIPLTYKKKDNIIVDQRVKELKGQELVLVQYEKAYDKIKVDRYYLVSTRTSRTDETLMNVLVPAENYAEFKRGKAKTVRIKFNEKTDRFYLGKCFDEVVAANPDMVKDWDGRVRHGTIQNK